MEFGLSLADANTEKFLGKVVGLGDCDCLYLFLAVDNFKVTQTILLVRV